MSAVPQPSDVPTPVFVRRGMIGLLDGAVPGQDVLPPNMTAFPQELLVPVDHPGLTLKWLPAGVSPARVAARKAESLQRCPTMEPMTAELDAGWAEEFLARQHAQSGIVASAEVSSFLLPTSKP